MSLLRRINLLLCDLKGSHQNLLKLLNLKMNNLMEILMKILLRRWLCSPTSLSIWQGRIGSLWVREVATKAPRKKIRRGASTIRSLDISLLIALIFRRKNQRTSQRNQVSTTKIKLSKQTQFLVSIKMSRHFSEIKAIWLAFDSLFYFTTEHLILREKGKKFRNTPLKRFRIRGLVT